VSGDNERRAENSKWVLNFDVLPAIVDVITSAEFHKRLIEPDPHPEKVVRLLLKQIFDRDVSNAEMKLLVEILEYMGSDGLVAGLVYGKEYRGKFGRGIPLIFGTAGAPSELSKTSRNAL
jgi:hypothetical protein